MIKTLLIAPYQGMVEVVKKIRQPDDMYLDTTVANLEDGVKVAKLAEKQGYELIISRGGTATMIQNEVLLPVVHIGITGYDMLRVFTLVQGLKKDIALVGYANISQGAATLCKILELDVKVITIQNRNEVKGYLEQLKQENYSVVIGDVITVQVAEQIGLQGILITSGKESLMEAFEEGKRLHNLYRKIKDQFYYLNKTFKFLPFPFVLLNKNNKILEKNEQFKQNIDSDVVKDSLVVSKLVQNALEEKSSQWGEIAGKNHKYEIQVFPVSKRESVAGLIFHRVKNKTRTSAMSIKNNPIYKPIIGESRSANRLRDYLDEFAYIDDSMCIVGEQGTGKRTIAQNIHFNMYGSGSPIFIINGHCLRAESDDLVQLKKKVISIQKGTILIKNINCIPLEMQKNILECLNFKHENTKIIALTTKPLDTLVYQDKFNEKLYQMVTEHFLHLPPLRERKDDIPYFVNYFLTEFHEKYGNEILGIKPDAVEYLKKFDWIGNLIQLKQIIKELSMLSKKCYVELTDVKTIMNRYKEKIHPVNFLQGTLEEIEQKIIKQVLEEEGFNQTKTANRLGINRSTLWRKLNK